MVTDDSVRAMALEAVSALQISRGQQQQQQQQFQLQQQASLRHTQHQPLPAGWQVLLDPQSGRQYFVDHNTGTTHWQLPSQAAPAVHQQPSPAQHAQGGLPAGWHALTDPTSGATYFFDANSGTTHWQLPR
jgi:uncharacterized protein YbdZ (MbtH family)